MTHVTHNPVKKQENSYLFLMYFFIWSLFNQESPISIKILIFKSVLDKIGTSNRWRTYNTKLTKNLNLTEMQLYSHEKNSNTII